MSWAALPQSSVCMVLHSMKNRYPPSPKAPHQIITASAPTRICDNGGWTDTWFAEYGTIFNIAIEPRAHVQISAWRCSPGEETIIISAANFGDRYIRNPGSAWQKHPLIEAAIDMMGLPKGFNYEIDLYSAAPPGASLGTSAAITVAMIGALDCLTPGRLTPNEIALLAQRVETEKLGGQCGIQDQLAAAYGGISLIEMFDYPHATVSPVKLADEIWWELENRLLVVYMGKPHDSSEIHSMVIKHLEDAGPQEPRLQALRTTAKPAMNALMSGDFKRFGDELIQNTAYQADLHTGLVSPLAQQVFEIGKSNGVIGWKVNGAGGEGGSLTLLTDGSQTKKRDLAAELTKRFPECSLISPRISRDGLRRYVKKNGQD